MPFSREPMGAGGSAGRRMAREARRVLWVGLAIAALVGCAAGPKVTVGDAWVRVSLPEQPRVLGYLTLTSDREAELVAVETPLAQGVEFAQWREVDHLEQLVKVETIPLPANRPLAFGPGTYQLWLLNPRKQYLLGEKVPLALTFRAGAAQTRVEVEAAVRRPLPSGFSGGAGLPPPGTGAGVPRVPGVPGVPGIPGTPPDLTSPADAPPGAGSMPRRRPVPPGVPQDLAPPAARP